MNLRTILPAVFITLFFQHAPAQSSMDMMMKYTGNWKAVVTMWMMPGDPSMSDSLVVHNEMVMNDLFFTSKYSGNMMMMNYEGERTVAYDVVKKKFVSIFIDNMNSGIDYKEGTASADGKSIELFGTKPDPITGKTLSTRDVISFIDDTHLKIEQFESADGNERKTLETNLTKQ